MQSSKWNSLEQKGDSEEEDFVSSIPYLRDSSMKMEIAVPSKTHYNSRKQSHGPHCNRGNI